MSIHLVMESWDDATHDAPEIRRTSGAFNIEVNGQCLTRNEDYWSQSVKLSTRVSVYPLALWLASSWWRLRWEPLPVGTRASPSWRMAHEVAASGYGFLWPQLVFCCDGERVHYWSIPTDSRSKQPVRYLPDSKGSISPQEFEYAVDEFIALVLERLEAVQLSTELKGLWEEVLEERADAGLSEYRKLEALLGFDPDDVAPAVVERFIHLGTEIGASVIGEVASVCSSADPIKGLDSLLAVADQKGIEGTFALSPQSVAVFHPDPRRPWERGQALAKAAREAIGLSGRAISDKELGDLGNLSGAAVFEESLEHTRLPIGLAVRGDNNQAKLMLRKRNRMGRRFEFARLLGDHLLSSEQDRWLPAADTKTVRQKWQRSFSAEFLCPIDALIERLGEEFSDDAMEEAAEYFGVSELTVRSQLVNHHYLPQFALGSDLEGGAYPYQI